MIKELQPQVAFQTTVGLQGSAAGMLGWKDIGPALVQEAALVANLLSLCGKCQGTQRAG